MKIDVSSLGRVFGDRILVKRLERPQKIGGLIVPSSYAKEKRKEQNVWYGVIQSFGLDSRYSEAYGLAVGETIAISDIANSNASFEGVDGHEYFWIMEEFVLALDTGRVSAFFDDMPYGGVGLLPVGPYCLIQPNPEEDKRNGVILPDTSRENLTGKVIAVSSGEVKDNELRPLRVSLASEVLFGKYAGLYAKFKKETFIFVKEEDLIAELTSAKELVNA